MHLLRRFIVIFVLIILLVGCGNDGDKQPTQLPFVSYNPIYTPSDTPNAATLEVYDATNTVRTAIAVTRNPELAAVATLHPAQVTATAFRNDVHTVEAIYPTLEVATLTARAVFQTEIAAWQTAHPDITPTRTPRIAPTCAVHFANIDLPEFARTINVALDSRDFLLSIANEISGSVVEFTLDGDGLDCADPYLLWSILRVSVWVSEDVASDYEMVAQITQEIVLAVMDMQLQPRQGVEPTRFSIRFYSEDSIQEILTNYENALAAVDEGLTGDDLLLALGGFTPEGFFRVSRD